MIEIWMENHLVSDNNCNDANLWCAFKKEKEWQIILGSHLVLVTLHGQFTISIEQGK